MYTHLWHFNFAFVDPLDDVMRVVAVDGAADRLSSAENLFADSSERLGHAARSHDSCDVNDVVHCDVAVVFH